jgi:hypothetical protein
MMMMSAFVLAHWNNSLGVDIKDLTSVDGKISDTQGKDFWRPIEIFPTGVCDFSVLPSYRCLILFLTNILLKVQYFPSWDTPYMKYDATHILTSLKNDVKSTEKYKIRKSHIAKNRNWSVSKVSNVTPLIVDTLSWFWAKPSLLLFLNSAHLAEKQTIPI